MCVTVHVCETERERENLVEFAQMTPRSQDSIAHSPDVVQGIRKKKLAGAGATLVGQSPRAPLGTRTQHRKTARSTWDTAGMESIGVSIRKGSLENVTLS